METTASNGTDKIKQPISNRNACAANNAISRDTITNRLEKEWLNNKSFFATIGKRIHSKKAKTINTHKAMVGNIT